jgi:LysM domain
MARALTEVPDVEPPRSITARVLAPLALVACALALFLLVSETLSGGGDDEDRSGRERERPRTEQQRNEPKVEGDTYVVVPGDTFIGIAQKTGIPVAKLERLNPDLDPATLNAGQQIKLRR